jgi:hypothetical protein
MDIRNPKLGAYLDIPERGLTNYLASKVWKYRIWLWSEGYEDLHASLSRDIINCRIIDEWQSGYAL